MQEADAQTVLGDFEDLTFEHRGEHFRFHQQGDRFFVETAGADGVTDDFEIGFTFGVEPLQQYLVRLPGGRLQALGVAWDTRPAAVGGQRWFHLQPDEAIPPGDVLHWTGPAGNWNAMCADCHSTNLQKGYQLDGDRYETHWSELDVACEACHGPGSAHLAWVDSGADASLDGAGLEVPLGSKRVWQLREEARIASRAPPSEPGGRGEIDVCAPCHSRRSRIAEAAHGDTFLDLYRPALIDEGLYHADGQIEDEVYVWGSFVQSRMYSAGVTCSDCHDPHGLRIAEPDAVCAGCHRAEAFDTPAHHHHPPGSAGASCVACHMPSRTYMVVDDRRDHGFRVPRPGVSERIGAPDPCTSCHSERSTGWAAETIADWNGGSAAPRVHPGEVLHAGRRQLPGAAASLASLADDRARPSILRASALRLLGAQQDPAWLPTLLAGLRDPEPLVRLVATEAVEVLPPRDRWIALEPMLRDEVGTVRIEAARVLAPLRRGITDPRASRNLDSALEEYREAQLQNADRPESHVNLGLLHDRLGEAKLAQRAYQTAVRVGPWFMPGYINLAELHRTQGREPDSERVLRQALTHHPDSADALHALGLLLVRHGKLDQALVSLERASILAPGNPRYAYAHGIALSSTGDLEAGLDVLARAHERHPGNPDLLVALATLHRDAGQLATARIHAQKLLALRPDDPGAQALMRQLE
ncbi:MAG: tetratricopeptide repeat protein [bacterium]|nr:tetratricopeptide repeat protein [bacterium]